MSGRDLVGDLADAGEECRVAIDRDAHAAPLLQLLEGRVDRRHALEHAALEHRVGELDVERVLERQHHVDARVRGHAGLEQVGLIVERLDVDRKPGVVAQYAADLFCHRAHDTAPVLASTTAAALWLLCVTLTERPVTPRSRASDAAAPVSSSDGCEPRRMRSSIERHGIGWSVLLKAFMVASFAAKHAARSLGLAPQESSSSSVYIRLR